MTRQFGQAFRAWRTCMSLHDTCIVLVQCSRICKNMDYWLMFRNTTLWLQ